MKQSTSHAEQQNLNSNELSVNFLNACLIYQQALSKMMLLKKSEKQEVNLDPLNAFGAILHFMEEFYSSPKNAIDKNFELAENYLKLYSNIMQRSVDETVPQAFDVKGRDNRFKDEEWEKNPALNFIKQSYLINSNWLQSLVNSAPHLASKEHHKIEFITKLLTDALCPTNFASINPTVCKETLATSGQNLLKGAENFLRDLNEQGSLKITTTNNSAFQIGKNLAVTPGKVVFENELMQLIQYSSQTNKNNETPLLIIPAWINKFYILDLQAQNSFVNWLIAQGHTVFMISWVNPTAAHSNVGFEEYLKSGTLAAIEQVQKLTKQSQINAMGYCLGGTLLACTLSYLKTKVAKDYPIKSATFLTSLVDFKDAGDICVFIDEEQISALEKRMSETGFLKGEDLTQTFNMIRSNDMIWFFYVNNYLLGKEPFPFDILFWNSDSTRLPALMHSFYLRKMYMQNQLIVPNAIELLGTKIDLRKIDIPTYILSTQEDHIAPWKITYAATQIYSGDIKFVLSGSGHVAGVANHPAQNKYNYWTNSKVPAKADDWFKNALENNGSWWVDWNKWNEKFAGQKIAARKITKFIEEAPGSYVKVRI